MQMIRTMPLMVALITWGVAAALAAGSSENLARVVAELVPPPALPAHDQIAQGNQKIVEVKLTVEEKKLTIDEQGTTVWAMTFNGSVPGPMIVVHEGDFVELTLVNPSTNLMDHNIDFHAATGAMGGGDLTHVAPGQQAIIRWQATKSGVFVYHCAPGGDMTPYHVVHGMNGAIMVLPRDGLKNANGQPLHYDRAYYIGEQDFYVPKDKSGKYMSFSHVGEDYADALPVMLSLTPSHIVFNGRAGALTGKNAMPAKVGERILILHSQANRDTRPHLIGGHGDFVWPYGKFGDAPATNLETWFVPGGAATAAMYTFREPGMYTYVTHNLIEAVLMGGAAQFHVEGLWNNDLMQQIKAPGPISSGD